jgi:hypothetical protein
MCRTIRRAARPAGAAILVVACALSCARPAGAADAEAGSDLSRALRAVAELRLRTDPAAATADDSWLALSWRGRASLEIKGRTAGAGVPVPLRDQAIFDLGTGRITTFVWFPNASTRKAGEPILSLSEISSRADAHVRLLFPRAALALESVERYRASGQESVYYEARFAAPLAEIPFLQPPVRLLLEASNGGFFRFDADPEWFAPPQVPAAHLSRKAAVRIAAAALGARELASGLGGGARPGTFGAAELFVVRPNDWLGQPGAEPAAQARVAWVVPFSLAGAPAVTAHRLFVDAATGRILGGIPGPR